MNRAGGGSAPKVAALLLMFCGAAAPAGACGFDGLLDGSFGAAHPKSLAVAFAIRDSITDGVVDRSAAEPIQKGSAGYWRAVGHLDDFQQALSAAAAKAGENTPSISILFIDSNLWAGLSPGPQGFDLQVHIAGPRPGDVTIVTSEAILTSALQRRLSVDELLARGVVVIDGDPAGTAAVRQLLEDGLARGISAANGVRSRPARLFGAAR